VFTESVLVRAHAVSGSGANVVKPRNKSALFGVFGERAFAVSERRSEVRQLGGDAGGDANDFVLFVRCHGLIPEKRSSAATVENGLSTRRAAVGPLATAKKRPWSAAARKGKRPRRALIDGARVARRQFLFAIPIRILGDAGDGIAASTRRVINLRRALSSLPELGSGDRCTDTELSGFRRASAEHVYEDAGLLFVAH
jgi:hypothetical protein